ncbi:spindle assembly checkpoint component MAD1-like isoform X1 [Centruroides sculpturatus]|uniref:spindle assembly checkpoint component MAD1-like isoform X1 n=1 Tax=Centruroides sculpturatus TaxID=218467 RepID=UPI000C6D8EFD|nr:spindle assembly checkpoint component MAD1-like isoform X1 [Centruroides sculpturatus]
MGISSLPVGLKEESNISKNNIMQRSPVKRGRPPLTRSRTENKQDYSGSSSSKLITDYGIQLNSDLQEEIRESNQQNLLSSTGESSNINSNSVTNLASHFDTSTALLWSKISDLIKDSNDKLLEQMVYIKEDIENIRQDIRESKEKQLYMEKEIKNLQQQLEQQKSENELMQFKIDSLNNDYNYKKVIVYNYPVEKSISTSEIYEFMTNVLNINDISQSDIIETNLITKKPNIVVRIIFNNKQIRDKFFYTFIQKKQLRNTSNEWKDMQMAPELTKNSRLRRKKLLPIFYEWRKQKDQVKLRNDILMINQEKITYSLKLCKLVYVNNFHPYSDQIDMNS